MNKKIAIDAKWLYEGPASGKVVIKNLIFNIQQKDRQNITLLLRKKDRFVAESDNDLRGFKKVFIPSINTLIDNTIILPITLFFYREISLVFSQNFTPLFGRFEKVAHIHDVLFLDFKTFYSVAERLYFFFLRFTSRRADKIITVSHTEKRRISHHYKISDEQIYVIYHGVSDIFKPSLIDFESRSDVLFVGRLNIRKNLDLLIDIWLNNEMKQKLFIVGDYDWKGDRYDPNSLIEKNIHFLGSKTHLEIVELMDNVRLFLFPSLAESFGLPIAEAMKSGVPVVCFDNTCISEIVGANYPTVENGNKVNYLNSINKMYYDKVYWSDVSETGIKNSKSYDWKNSVTNLLDIFR